MFYIYKLAISPKLSTKSLILSSACPLYMHAKTVFKVQSILNILANERYFFCLVLIQVWQKPATQQRDGGAWIRRQSAHDAELWLVTPVAAELCNGTEEDFVPIEQLIA